MHIPYGTVLAATSLQGGHHERRRQPAERGGHYPPSIGEVAPQRGIIRIGTQGQKDPSPIPETTPLSTPLSTPLFADPASADFQSFLAPLKEYNYPHDTSTHSSSSSSSSSLSPAIAHTIEIHLSTAPSPDINSFRQIGSRDAEDEPSQPKESWKQWKAWPWNWPRPWKKSKSKSDKSANKDDVDESVPPELLPVMASPPPQSPAFLTAIDEANNFKNKPDNSQLLALYGMFLRGPSHVFFSSPSFPLCPPPRLLAT